MAKKSDIMMNMKGRRKPQNAFKTLFRIVSYFKHCRTLIVCAMLSILLYSAATIAAAYLVRPLVNYLEVSGISPNEAYAKFTAVLIGMAALYVFSVITNYLLNRLMLEATVRILERLRTDMFDKMQLLPISFFDTHTHGEVMSYYSNDVEAVSEMLRHCITQLMISTVSLVGVISMMLVLSLKLFLIMIVLGVIVVIVVRIVSVKSSKNFRRQQETVSKVNGYIEEMVTGQKDVKVFNHEEKMMQDFEPINEDLRECGTKASSYANIVGPVLNNLSHIFYAITTTVGVLWLTGEFIGGVLVAFLSYVRQFAERLSQISQQFNFIMLALAGAERIFGVIDEQPEDNSGDTVLVQRDGEWYWHTQNEDGCFSDTRLAGDVRFNRVSFSYDGKKTVLKAMSLYAKPGQKIAFVGSTGAGKTTITNLINRFYDIDEGEILFDGLNIKRIKKSELRRALGFVLQDTHLFTGTVMENIRYGKLDATDEDCITAAKIANADYFISHLPEGYQTVLYSDGSNLSQGQRQLIAIARAAVSKTPVLILDEATSSIDTRTERLIEQGMDALMTGRTVFVIAHRLSTVRNSDAIMVLEDGQIIERGNHEELLKQRGSYYKLYTGMFELT